MSRDLTAYRPEVGIVLGSGLGGFADQCDARITEFSFVEVGLPPVTVAGHKGRFILAELAGQAVLLMQGRLHLYEGRSAIEVASGVKWLAAQGVRTLVLTNAAGCLNPNFLPGEWMMIADQLNLTGTTPLIGGPHFHDMSEIYSVRLCRMFHALAAERGAVLREGIYAGMLGPQYESPAEVRMLRTLGADAVGMSTVLEAIQARALGLEVAGFSCLTNWATGLTKRPIDHSEVIEVGHQAASRLATLLVAWVRERSAAP
jgi:purine-nucleoside phosphorylase